MPQPAWANFFRPRPAGETPDSFRFVFAALSGAALSFSYTGFYLSIYSWVCVGILLITLFGARPRIAFVCGFLHSLFFVITCFPWIATVLFEHGNIPKIASWALVGLIGCYFGLLMGAFAWTVNRLSQHSLLLGCIGAPFLWVAFEFARVHVPAISFPWGLLGYPASANMGLLQITTVTGIYGLSFLVAAANALLAWGDASASVSAVRRLTVLGISFAVLLTVLVAGPRFVPAPPPPKHYARAVQLNFPELPEFPAKWFPTHAADLQEIEQLSVAKDARNPDLLIWPEAPAPFSFQDQNFVKIASSLAIQFGHPLLVGAIEWRPLPSAQANPKTMHLLVPYNSAVLVDAQGNDVFTYDKIHLVPFGEYEPFPLIHRVVTSVSSEVGGFQRGSKYAVARLPGGSTFSAFICYEATYPGEIRNFAAYGAELLVNISNDGWFGRSAAPEQHLLIARVRAAENRRWMLRVTNNGITVSVDPYGRILRLVPPDIRAAVDLPYDFRTDQTLYTRFGDWFAWLCVLVSAILLASTFRKGNIAGEGISIPVDIAAPSLAAGS
jgi:apolipoprotein N-acyltransferase